MNSASPPPASCSPLIRRSCAGLGAAGLSSQPRFPLHMPLFHSLSCSDSKVWAAERHVCHHSGLGGIGRHSGLHWRRCNGGVRQDKRAGVVHIPGATNNLNWLNSLTQHRAPRTKLRRLGPVIDHFYGDCKRPFLDWLFYEGQSCEGNGGHRVAFRLWIYPKEMQLFCLKPFDTSAACVQEKTIYCSNLLIFTTEQITIYVHL